MASQQFLVRSRHQSNWYGRVIIPVSLRNHFNGKRELRKSLETSNKQEAKCLSLMFWLECQSGFQRLKQSRINKAPFKNASVFVDWMKTEHLGQGYIKDMKYIEIGLPGAGKAVIDLDDPKEEAKLALQLQANAAALLDQFKDNPEMLDRIFRIKTEYQIREDSVPETTICFDEAVDLYINQLKTRGRKGKKLSKRTLQNYEGRLLFWKEYFDNRPTHEILLKELGEIQDWLPWLQTNYKKRKALGYYPISTDHACFNAKAEYNKSRDITGEPKEFSSEYISTKTLAEYLSQLKGILEFCFSRGFIPNDLSAHIEIPNTKQTKAIKRLPFTDEDLQKIFPQNYGEEFAAQRSGIDHNAKYWLPLIALYSGARLEEIAQLQTKDIKTCPETNIVYAMIDDQGAAADGEKKRTKNQNSVRPIPIHSKLIALGFLDYVAQRSKDTTDQGLFKLKRDKQGRLAKTVGNWFSRMDKRKNGSYILGYIERCGVESKSIDKAGQRWSKSFHSFRHTVTDNLRGKKMANGEYIREDDIALVIGHRKNEKETANYGQDRMQLELRHAVIESINYNL